MITNKNEAKAMTRHISHDCKCNFTSTTYNSNQKWNKKHVNVNVKFIASAKKIIVGILTYVFVKIAITWYFSYHVWWNNICYGYCISKNDKCYSNKCNKKLSY